MLNASAVIARDAYIGNVAGAYTGYRNDSARLYVSARAYSRTGRFRTTRHGYTGRVRGIGIMADVRYRPDTDSIMAGQVRWALDHVVKFAHSWDAVKVRRLGEIWDRWHLADVQPGCVHMPHGHPGDVCPYTGYEWGSKWLVESTPAPVIAELENMFR